MRPPVTADGALSERPPRIAYMLGVFPALTETFVAREIAAIRRRGLDVVICAMRRPQGGESITRVGEGNGKVWYARPDRLGSHLVANMLAMFRQPARYVAAVRTFLGAAAGLPPAEGLQLLYHFFAGVGFARDLARLGVTHLHCHFTSGTNMALAASMVAETSFSFTAHASDDLFVRPLLLSEKVGRARFVAAVCEYSRRYLDSITGYRFSDRLHRVYNGIERPEPAGDPATSSDRPTENGAPPRLVAVGSLVAAKGHATLIEVCAGLQARGFDFQCRIIGEGPERAVLERLVRDLGLEKKVQLLGAQPQEAVYRELRQADVFALLSEIGPRGYRDGFPTVILEAMAAELPVLSTSLSGIPEMVVEGVTGFLVRERDVEGAIRALECLLQSGELRRAMGRAGGERVRAEFDLESSADQLATLLSPGAAGESTAHSTTVSGR